MPPHSVIVHPEAPRPHPINPVILKPRDAEVIRNLGGQFIANANKLLEKFVEDANAPRVAARADTYASSLSRYWSYYREKSGDIYLYSDHGHTGWHADAVWFRGKNDALKEIDRALTKQLEKWEIVTSPYADKLDWVAISEASQDLEGTIKSAVAKLPNAREMPNDNPQSVAEVAYETTIYGALVGMSQQIGKRLKALADGKPQPASFTRQIVEFLERGREQDKERLGQEITSEANDLQAIHEQFSKSDFGVGTLKDIRHRQELLISKLRDPRLPVGHREKLLREKAKVDASLRAWEQGMSMASMSGTQREQLKNARDAFNGAVKKLGKDPSFAARAEWTRLGEELLKLETPFVDRTKKAVESLANSARSRSEQYEQTLADAKVVADTDGAQKLWPAVRKRCLAESKGSEVGEALEKAFDGKLTDKLAEWNKKSGKDNPDGNELQHLAADLGELIESYSSRAKFLMRDDSKLQPVNDRLQGGLQAIRDSIAATLQTLLDQGAFGDPFS